jgi:hypothetical protein
VAVFAVECDATFGDLAFNRGAVGESEFRFFFGLSLMDFQTLVGSKEYEAPLSTVSLSLRDWPVGPVTVAST